MNVVPNVVVSNECGLKWMVSIVMEPKYMNCNQAQWKEPELATEISELGVGRKLLSKVLVLQRKT